MENDETKFEETTEESEVTDTTEESTDFDAILKENEELRLRNEELQKKSHTDAEQKKHYREKFEKLKKSKGDKPKKEELSVKDAYALMGAGVPEDDVDEVLKMSRILSKDENKPLSMKETLEDDIVKTILKRRQEERKAEIATNSGKAKTGNAEVSGDELNRRLIEKREIPKPGSKEAEDLFWARRGGRR